jgi:hypothetical protein
VAKKKKLAQNAAQKPELALPWSKNYSLELARHVTGYLKRYVSGERWVLILALDACLNASRNRSRDPSLDAHLTKCYLPRPWMLKALWDVATALEDGADPNEAFGFERPKGKHVKANRAKKRNERAILFRIYDLHCNQGEALDDSGAFAIVAEEFNSSARTIRRVHDAAPEWRKTWLKRGVRESRPKDIAEFDR